MQPHPNPRKTADDLTLLPGRHKPAVTIIDRGAGRLYLKHTTIKDRVQLMHGDALLLLKTVDVVDAVITDPPYSSGGRTTSQRQAPTSSKYQSSDAKRIHPNFDGDAKDQRSWTNWCATWLTLARERTKQGGLIAVFSDWRQLPSLTDAVQFAGWIWKGIIAWDKVNARPVPHGFRAQCEYVVWGTNGDVPADRKPTYHAGMFRQPIVSAKSRQHAAQKPVELITSLVAATPDGATILDPFAGSGTTGVAALRSGRRFLGIESNNQIFEQALTRLAEIDEPRSA